MAIGREGVEIERYNGGARGLRAPDPLDRWVQPRHRRVFARDQTGCLILLTRCRQTRPKLARGGSIMDHNPVEPFAFEREDDILVLHFFRPAKLSKLICDPVFKKTKKCLKPLIGR